MIFKIAGWLLLLMTESLMAKVNIEHWQTSQGSPVYFIAAPELPIADIKVVFDAGSARDGQQFGIAALTAALLDTGAEKWNADQIAQRLESVGAALGSDVSYDMATLSLRTLTDPKLLDVALETMHTVLLSPRFAEADFKRDLARTLAGLKQLEESPAAQADIAFTKALYGDHPYGHTSEGELAKPIDYPF